MFLISEIVDEIKLPIEVIKPICKAIGILDSHLDNAVTLKTYRRFLENALITLENPYKSRLDSKTKPTKKLPLLLLVDQYKRRLDSKTCAQIYSIKIELNRLTGKKRLSLVGLDLVQIPEKVFNLTHLEIFDFSDNKLKEIPK